MRPSSALVLSAAAIAAGLAAAAGVAAASGALRHMALPVLVDPSRPPRPVAPPPTARAGCTARELFRAPGRVSALLPLADGSLWVGTFDRGALVLAPSGRAEPVPGLDGREAFVNALADGGRSGVWLGTQRGAILFRRGARVATALPGEPVSAFARADGVLLAGGARGLHRLRTDGRAEEVRFERGTPRINALTRSGSELFLGTAEGVRVVQAGALAGGDPVPARWLPLVFGSPASGTDVVPALAALGAAVLAGTDDGGLVLVAPGAAPSAHRFPAGPENLVNPGAAAEAAGMAAVGTQGGGLLLVRAAPAGGLTVARAGGTAGWSVSAVADVPGGWLVGTDDGRVVALACPASD